MKIISRKEAKEQKLFRYYTGNPCVQGHDAEKYTKDGACVVCKTASYIKYRDGNLERERTRKREWMQDFRDSLSDEEREEYNNSFYSRYPDRYKLNAHIRHKVFKKCTPPWVDMKAIREIYRNCPEGYHVDHIIPLRGVMPDGSPTSGLHVPWNLQYLPAKENRVKSNKVQLHEINELV